MINSRTHAGSPHPPPASRAQHSPGLDPGRDTCTPGNLTWLVVLVMGKLPTSPVFTIPGCREVPSLSAPLTSGLAFSVLYLGRPVCLLSD